MFQLLERDALTVSFKVLAGCSKNLKILPGPTGSFFYLLIAWSAFALIIQVMLQVCWFLKLLWDEDFLAASRHIGFVPLSADLE